jgi:glucose/arabinose dehydrogenase
MRRLTCLAGLLLTAAPLTAASPPPRPLVTGLPHPASVAIGTDGRTYVTTLGEINRDGDGAILVLEGGKAVPFATGLDAPRGLAVWGEWLFVADRHRVLRVGRKGVPEVFAASAAFPSPPHSLRDIDVDEQGNFYVSDPGDGAGHRGAIYRISPRGEVSLAADATRSPRLRRPAGLVLDGASHLLVTDLGSGQLSRLSLADGTTTRVAGGARALAWDKFGRLFLSDSQSGRVFGIPRPGAKPVLLASGFRSAAGLCVDRAGQGVLVADTEAGTVTDLPAAIPGHAVDETPMPLETAVAFPNLQWAGWEPENEKGQLVPLRPIVLTHAGDGSDRVFVATQHGVIHVFPNDQKATQTKVFLDIHKKVHYDDQENEEGFLGLAFHPRFKENGEFFVFYTTSRARHTNILARFRVRRDDPDRADPASEEQLLVIKKVFWNHDGGTLCFGPDGYLYVALGDGGAAGDPFNNAQDLGRVFGKVLRLDVDHKDPGKNYASPRDNPFVGKPGARPEVWAYGLRNVWRMAFDRKTGELWAGDVGQDLYEEIDLVVRGGNYGWRVREGLHPFGAQGSGPRPDLIEPIWEYRHDVGKSIIGGTVYRGRRLPELEGQYLYADYISNKLWALRYDRAAQRVVANRGIRDPNVPVLSFGEDEQGEVYFLTFSVTGQGIYRFVRPGPARGK